MKETLRKLVDLCDLDRVGHAIEEQLRVYPRLLAEMQAKEASARKKDEATAARFQQVRESRRKAELDISSLRERINKYLLQQNMVKTNKEYEAITHEIDGVKNQIDTLETAALEGLEEEEKLEHERADIQKNLKTLKEEHEQERRRIERQIEEKNVRVEEYHAERESRLAALEATDREHYLLLDQRYPGHGLARMENSSCVECGRHQAPQLALHVRHMEKLVQCEGCMRILYAPLALEAGN